MKASLLFLLAVLGCIYAVYAAPTTTTPKPTPSPWFKCSGEGNFPNPYDCSKYFICVKDAYGDLTAWAMKCPGRLWYNPKKGLCDFKGNVECKAHPTKSL